MAKDASDSPTLVLLAGLAAGAIGVRLVTSARAKANVAAALASGRSAARDGLARSGSGLRASAVSGLGAVERGSARLRERIEAEGPNEAAPEADDPGAPPRGPSPASDAGSA